MSEPIWYESRDYFRRTIKPRLAPVLFGEGMFEVRARDEREKLVSEASTLTGGCWRKEEEAVLANWAFSSRSRFIAAASSALSCSTSERRVFSG